jgi:hypothetical protein
MSFYILYLTAPVDNQPAPHKGYYRKSSKVFVKYSRAP